MPRVHLPLALILFVVVNAAVADPGAAVVSAYANIEPEVFAKVKSDFYKAALSLEATRIAIASMDEAFAGTLETWPGIARAYRASLEGLLGKHATLLSEKFARVNNAIEMFDGLVESWPDSLEIRFLRYSFFSQLPVIFGVGHYVKPDLEAIIILFESGNDNSVPRRQMLDMEEWLRAEGKLSKSDLDRLTMATKQWR